MDFLLKSHTHKKPTVLSTVLFNQRHLRHTVLWICPGWLLFGNCTSSSSTRASTCPIKRPVSLHWMLHQTSPTLTRIWLDKQPIFRRQSSKMAQCYLLSSSRCPPPYALPSLVDDCVKQVSTSGWSLSAALQNRSRGGSPLTKHRSTRFRVKVSALICSSLNLS